MAVISQRCRFTRVFFCESTPLGLSNRAAWRCAGAAKVRSTTPRPRAQSAVLEYIPAMPTWREVTSRATARQVPDSISDLKHKSEKVTITIAHLNFTNWFIG
ncbi:jg26154 [Pararge aegeria aegeria]|uniref:Jg26154 protein n=1 Tax=Pararge aegeria aegeria TaxID=348720 RepID=A0A8S4S784_9NEOP|nr:jg26154 [Pararge aegeria aegeria]